MGFLGTWWGQLVLAAGSVVFLVVAKGLTRRPGDRRADNRPFQWDDFAIGLDLLVLSIVTLVGYAASQHRAESVLNANGTLSAKDKQEAVELIQKHQTTALSLAAIAFLLFVSVGWMIQWYGQFTREERAAWKVAKLESLKTAGILEQLKAGKPDLTEVDLALEIGEAPRFKIWFGLLVPAVIGVLMLMFAIQAVTQ